MPWFVEAAALVALLAGENRECCRACMPLFKGHVRQHVVLEVFCSNDGITASEALQVSGWRCRLLEINGSICLAMHFGVQEYNVDEYGYEWMVMNVQQYEP